MSQSDNRAGSDWTAAAAPVPRPVAPAVTTPAAPVVTRPAVVPAPATAPAVPPPSASRTPDEIERDIEATRVRLASSIDELADRVSPKNVAKRGADKARLTVVDETGAPRTTRLAAIGAAVAAVAGIVLWRRRG